MSRVRFLSSPEFEGADAGTAGVLACLPPLNDRLEIGAGGDACAPSTEAPLPFDVPLVEAAGEDACGSNADLRFDEFPF